MHNRLQRSLNLSRVDVHPDAFALWGLDKKVTGIPWGLTLTNSEDNFATISQVVKARPAALVSPLCAVVYHTKA